MIVIWNGMDLLVLIGLGIVALVMLIGGIWEKYK